jgi:SAM-dependent methyltransferase
MGRGRLCARRRLRAGARRGGARAARPAAGRAILDVGCGDGTLTLKIIERGRDVIGIDKPEMVEAARARGLDARLMDAALELKFGEAFDAAFSNATLHWVLDKERGARAIFRAQARRPLRRRDGRRGQSRDAARGARRRAGRARLWPADRGRNWYPTPRNSSAVYELAGFKRDRRRLIERPTPLEHGVAAWVTTFRAGWLDRAGVPEWERTRSPPPSPTASAPTRRLCPPSLHHEEAGGMN